jgi:hypothetical protein
MGVFAISLVLVPPLPSRLRVIALVVLQCRRCSVFFQDGERAGGGT